ncbi:hypothetical protein ACX93W_10420 [Paenibacillus sp. CAU 1782]
MKDVLVKRDGTVSIFGVIILSSLLLFFGVLIDYARIAAFQLQSESGVRSAIRSVMSAYDETLYEQYGLFGRGGTEGGLIFEEVLKQTLEKKAVFLDGGFDLAATRVEGTSLNTSLTLGRHDVFARGVLEEMKYKAPVDFTLELLSKFTPLAKTLKESSAAVASLDQLRALYEKREKLLEEALHQQESAGREAAANKAVSLIPAGSGSAFSYMTAAGYASGVEGYVSMMQYDAALPPEEKRKFTAEIWRFQYEAGKLSAALQEEAAVMEQNHKAKLELAKQRIQEAEQVNQSMKTVLQKAEHAAAQGYEEVAAGEAPGSVSAEISGGDEIKDIVKDGSKLIRDEVWFAAYVNELDGQTGEIAVLSGLLQQFGRRVLSGVQSSSHASDMTALAGSLSSAYNKYGQRYVSPATVLSRRAAELEDQDIKRQLREQEKKKGSLWSEAGQLLKGMANSKESEEHAEVFRQVQLKYERNLRYNGAGDTAGEGAGAADFPRAGDANEGAVQASAEMDGLFSGMADMLARSRDYFYYGEYAAARFTSFDPLQLRSLLEAGSSEALSSASSFYNQEMEYVLYGFHNTKGNLLAAYGELFAVRLAVRTMEGLIESRSLGHPLLVLSAAIIYGLEHTIQDMLSFAQKGSAPLSKYVKVELAYKDYLRLFMLLHGGSQDKRLARMIAVIEQNCGITLAEVPSGVTGEATVSMQLWFLPGVMKLLNRAQGMGGRVVGNRYEAHHLAGHSY